MRPWNFTLKSTHCNAQLAKKECNTQKPKNPQPNKEFYVFLTIIKILRKLLDSLRVYTE